MEGKVMRNVKPTPEVWCPNWSSGNETAKSCDGDAAGSGRDGSGGDATAESARAVDECTVVSLSSSQHSVNGRGDERAASSSSDGGEQGSPFGYPVTAALKSIRWAVAVSFLLPAVAGWLVTVEGGEGDEGWGDDDGRATRGWGQDATGDQGTKVGGGEWLLLSLSTDKLLLLLLLTSCDEDARSKGCDGGEDEATGKGSDCGGGDAASVSCNGGKEDPASRSSKDSGEEAAGKSSDGKEGAERKSSESGR
jgi:hypothetical protein